MNTAPSETFQARKARLRASFLEQMPERIADARRQFAGLDPTSPQTEVLQALHLIFHTLKGSGASFGFREISDLAREADDALRQALDGSAIESLLATVGPVLERLADPDLDWSSTTSGGERFGFEPAPQPTEQPTEQPGARVPEPRATPAPPSGPDQGSGRGRRIYICDDDTNLGEQLCAQLACFGYQATAFASPDALRAAAAAQPPAAVIMDVIFPEGDEAGPAAIAALNAESIQPVPSIFISCRDDFQARLRAVQAGGSAYCAKPVKTTELVELLDTLAQREAPAPYHVLVVDDDPNVARLHAMVLEEAGMITRTATRPEQVLELLRGFNADLVLMDMYMPGCSGPELARVLRQIPGHVSLPIVYVSSETDLDRQCEAMEVGADGFLTKPVQPARLVTEVGLRAERMRTLHALMVRDGLTGLLNHNTIMQFLQVGVANAYRDGRPLCFAMIDVDRFKQVNDRHGHPAGDQVLMALSRGLKLRLRESDTVGRYGGEEFAVVLAGTDAAQGRDILDQLREAFANVVFYAGDERFTCTFSAGVAELGLFPSPDSLIEGADLALYRAKRTGRNRVEIATPADLGQGEREADHDR